MTDTADTDVLNGYFRDRDINSLAEDLRNRRVTSVELVGHSLAAIARLNPILNAFTSVGADNAMAGAERADDELARGRDRGPLHGIPVSVKDLIDIAGQVTTRGSKVHRHRPAEHDAECVRRLRAAGAVIVGKNVLHEFAYGATGDRSAHGASRNPSDPTRISGGSSGGGAAATAAGMVPLAVGTDTAGSVRVPAALCGVVGFKPAYGAIRTRGVHPLAPSLDHVGIFAGTSADAALGYAVMAGTVQPLGKASARVGWLDPSCIGPTDPAVTATVRAALEVAGLLSDDVVRLPFRAGELFSVLSVLQASEAYAEHADDLTGRRDDIDPEVVDRLIRGRQMSAWEYLRADRARDELRSATAELFRRFDVIAMPTVPTVATDVDQRAHVIDGEAVEVRSALLSLTCPWNLTGQPAVSLPVGGVSGLPVGLQLITATGREHMMFGVADAVEGALR
ncbi:amidase [Mycobacterium manitobense]|uniref:Amidase n=1 Tax=[Mycobacterium] manitobense TaxID=190147 RepID=A0A9X2Y6B5_9MYCO|nr:amidase [[Mycobacterium] manitobense]MCV7168743.1 amidase [[Mycobacterium] manitobense]